jgi:hypothetical protein
MACPTPSVSSENEVNGLPRWHPVGTRENARLLNGGPEQVPNPAYTR